MCKPDTQFVASGTRHVCEILEENGGSRWLAGSLSRHECRIGVSVRCRSALAPAFSKPRVAVARCLSARTAMMLVGAEDTDPNVHRGTPGFLGTAHAPRGPASLTG